MESQLLYSTLINESGKILSCNELFRKKLGFGSSSDVIGKNIFEVFKSWEKDKLAQAIDTCKANPELSITITVHYGASRHRRHVYQWTITGGKNEDGKAIIHLIGKSTDIEKGKFAKDILENHAFFEELMTHCPIAGWVTDEQGRLRFMNSAYLSAYGLKAEDLGKSIFELLPKAIAVEYFKNNCAVLEEMEAIETVEQGINAQGQEQTIKVYRFPLQVEGKRMVACWALDLSDQVAMQEQLSKNAERYYFTNKATSDAIYDWDFQRKVIYRGKGFQNLFGHTNWRSCVRAGLQYIHPSDMQRVKESVFAALRNHETDRWEIEYRLQDASGNYKRIVDKAFIIRKDGKVVRIIGAMQDVTEQKALRQLLLSQEKTNRREIATSIIKAQENERMDISGELHDNVNQILSSCKLLLEVAGKDKVMAPELIERAQVHMETAIAEIRRISHQLNPSAVLKLGLKAAVSQMIANLNASGTIKIKFVHRGLSEEDGLKDNDRVAIFRIIQEMLANTLKHAKAKNTLIKLSLQKGILRLIMSDDGVGFDPEKVKKGIGLSNIQNRVECYQGTMKFETSPGNGCRTEIILRLSGDTHL